MVHIEGCAQIIWLYYAILYKGQASADVHWCSEEGTGPLELEVQWLRGTMRVLGPVQEYQVLLASEMTLQTYALENWFRS